MSSTLGCRTLASKMEIPSSARRSGTSVTPSLTCHVIWHHLYFAPRPTLRSPPHPPTPPLAGLSGLVSSPRLSPNPPICTLMSSMVVPANSISAPYSECHLMCIRWPDLAASFLREANSGLLVSFTVFVNDNGGVSLTVIDPPVPAASCSLFLEALAHKLNQSLPVGNNPWVPFRLAPTDLQFAIHSLPIKANPEGHAALCDLLQPSILNSQSILISKARFLNPDGVSHAHDKQAFSVVVQVPAEDGKFLTDLSRIPILGGNYAIDRAYPSSPSKQGNNCWRFGHVKPRCKNSTVCPLCTGPHAKAEHRCPNPTCPKGGILKPVLNCCIATPARCPNCSEDHSADYRDCTARPIPPPRTAPDVSEVEDTAPTAPGRPPQSAARQLPSTNSDAMDIQPDEAGPSRSLLHTPLLGLESPLEFATPRTPLCPALWVPRDPPPGPVAPNPMGSPAPPLPLEISRPRAGIGLTIHLPHLGAAPPTLLVPCSAQQPRKLGFVSFLVEFYCFS